MPLNLAVSDLLGEFQRFLASLPPLVQKSSSAPSVLASLREFSRRTENVLSPAPTQRTIFLGICTCGSALYPVILPGMAAVTCIDCGIEYELAARRTELFEAVLAWRGTAISLGRLLGPYFGRSSAKVAGRIYLLAHRADPRLEELPPLPGSTRATFLLGQVLSVLTSDDRLRNGGMISHAPPP